MTELPIMQQSLVETPAPQPASAEASANVEQEETEKKLPFNQVVLLDGTIVVLRRSKGRDLRNAARLTENGTEIEYGMALSASCSSINGTPINYEDFLDFDLADCQSIIQKHQAMMGNG